jgi:quercetin dioxygenase-like cupin family protein
VRQGRANPAVAALKTWLMERLAEVSGKSVIAGAIRLAAGRSTALKLAGRQTRDRIMLFEETAPVGTDTTFHLHHDGDEVAYVLSSEISVETGNEFSVGGPGTCAFLPGGVPHAWNNTAPGIGHALFLYTPAGANRFFEEKLERPAGSINGAEVNEIRRRTGGRSSARRLSNL